MRVFVACWQTCGNFIIFSNKSQQKTAKKALFLVILQVYAVIFSPGLWAGFTPEIILKTINTRIIINP